MNRCIPYKYNRYLKKCDGGVINFNFKFKKTVICFFKKGREYATKVFSKVSYR